MLTALPTASIIRAALWGFGQLFPFSEFFDNPGQSLIQSAEDLLSWFRIGRYLQCPPRKELQDTQFATSPTRPSYSRLRTFRRGSQVPRNPSFDSVNCIKRPVDQIHNLLVWRAVQRESLNTRQGSKAGKIRVRTGREKMWLPPLRAKEKRVGLHILVASLLSGRIDNLKIALTSFPPVSNLNQELLESYGSMI